MGGSSVVCLQKRIESGVADISCPSGIIDVANIKFGVIDRNA